MGTNPYLDAEPPAPPSRSYRLRLRNSGLIIEVDPDALPDAHVDGNAGSVLSLLLRAGVEIDHACGGVIACSTCHIYVNEGLDSSPDPIEEEEDMLDLAPALRDCSRLACQFVPDGSQDVEVEIPAWNRNEVSEEH